MSFMPHLSLRMNFICKKKADQLQPTCEGLAAPLHSILSNVDGIIQQNTNL